MSGRLTNEQREVLLRPVNPTRVLLAQGQSHLPAYDVEAHLTRIFGFEGWDREITELWLIHETPLEKGGRTGWTVTYGCKLRLTTRDVDGNVIATRDGAATGSANNLPSRGDAHDFAMKNADSYALKRAAKSFGDQFGLSLYNKGSTKALIKTVIAYGHGETNDYEAPQSMGNDEREMDADYNGEGPPGFVSGRGSLIDDTPVLIEGVHYNREARTSDPAPHVASSKQIGMIRAQFKELNVVERPAQIAYVQAVVGEREITSLTELSVAEASAIINQQQEDKAIMGGSDA